jgi:hypothetical protein
LGRSDVDEEKTSDEREDGEVSRIARVPSGQHELPAEVELRTAAIDGRAVCRGDPKVAAVTDGHAWGDDRIVRAELLFELLARTAGTQELRAVVLVGLRITGRLNFEAAELHAPLIAHNCYFDEPVNFMAARAPTIALTACRLRGVAADQLETRGNLEIEHSVAETISLHGAHIGGWVGLNGLTMTGGSYPLDLTEGTLRPAEVDISDALEGIALMADGLRVDHDMFCRFWAYGEVRLMGAHIGGQLVFEGATLARGLVAHGLRVERGMFCRQGFSAHGEISLVGAQIADQLVFEGATLGDGLDAQRLRVDGDMFCPEGFSADGEVRLLGAQIGGQLSFTGAELRRGLLADGLRVDGNMSCKQGFSADGEVRLLGAHIGGQLSFEGAEKLSRGLVADRLQVDGNMFCRQGFSADREVCLLGAQIGGQLSFDGATLRDELDAQGLRVDGNMRCKHGFSATREVRLHGAQIGGQLVFDGAALRRGLLADGLRVDGDLFCQEGFSADGEVRLFGAHIGGLLSFNQATNLDPALALNLQGARVDRSLHLRFEPSDRDRRRGLVDLTGSQLGKLFDSEEAWPATLRLRGCVYGGAAASEDEQTREGMRGVRGGVARRSGLARVFSRAPEDVRRRLRWIQRAEDGVDSREGGEGYAPQPYTQLMGVYRQEGRDADARRVAYERERRRRGQLGSLGKTWNFFLQWTVGYGYRPLRALAWLGALVFAGSLVFSSFHSDGDLTAVREEHPPFVATIYTLDRLIPIVSFGLRDAFAPAGAAQWWAFAYTLAGWALTTAVVAGVTAAVRRE